MQHLGLLCYRLALEKISMSCFCLLCSALSHMRWRTTHFNVGLRPGDFFFIFYFFSALNPVRSPMCRQAGEKQRWAGPPSPSWLPVISLCFQLCLNTVSLSSHLTTRSEPRHHLQNPSESSHTLQTQKLLVFKTHSIFATCSSFASAALFST